MTAVIDPGLATWGLPVGIFFARICDVSLGTLRIIVVARGRRFTAAVLGFFEVLIWITVVSRVIGNLTNPWCYVAYAAGFAAGNYVGIWLEQRLAMGQQVIRVITQQPTDALIEALHQHDFGVTCFEAKGSTGPVHEVYSIVHRSDLDEVISIIRQFHPRAFFSVEDVRLVQEGVFPIRRTGRGLLRWRWRKGK